MDAPNVISKSHILEQLLDVTLEGFWFINNDLVTLDVNSAMCELLSRRRHEIIGHSIFEFVDEENAEIFRRQIERRRKGKRGSYEISLQHPDGTNIPCVNNASPVYNEDGHKIASIGLWTDITDIKRVEQELRLARDELEARVQERTTELAKAYEELRDSEQQFRLVTNNIPVLIAYIDRDLIVRFANQPYSDYCGIYQDDIVGMRLADVVGEKRLNSNMSQVSRTLAGELLSNERVWSNHRGEQRYFRTTRIPHFHDNGDIPGYFIIHVDLTEHVERQKQIRQTQKMESLGTLSGGIAHELNNILMPILGLTELAIDELPEASTPRKNLGLVLQNTERAAELVSKILSFSRQEEAKREPIDLREFVEEEMGLLDASLPATIDVRLDLEEDPVTILADETQIHQVLMNLASNAAHAMGGKVGVLRIGLSLVDVEESDGRSGLELRPRAYAKLSVKDSGHGMDGATMEHIFEPFFTTKAVGEGTGMGLAMIHGIVMAHGGAVDVASEPGAGTTFDIYLPLAEKDNPGGERLEQRSQ